MLIAPSISLVLVIVGFHSVLVSNKIAGPLYRFRATFQKIIEGDISGSVKIRKGDLLINEQTKIGEMVSILKSRIGRIQEEQDAMGPLLARIRGQELSADAKAALTQIEEHFEKMKNEARFFKIT